MDIRQEIRNLIPIFPLFLVLSLVALGLLAVFHGVGWYLIFIAIGLLIGLPILDIDKVLAKYLGTSPDLFHTFQVYLILFVLAVFILTASGSMIGKGIIIGMLISGVTFIKGKYNVWIGYGILGLALILLIFG